MGRVYIYLFGLYVRSHLFWLRRFTRVVFQNISNIYSNWYTRRKWFVFWRCKLSAIPILQCLALCVCVSLSARLVGSAAFAKLYMRKNVALYVRQFAVPHTCPKCFVSALMANDLGINRRARSQCAFSRLSGIALNFL